MIQISITKATHKLSAAGLDVGNASSTLETQKIVTEQLSTILTEMEIIVEKIKQCSEIIKELPTM